MGVKFETVRQARVLRQAAGLAVLLCVTLIYTPFVSAAEPNVITAGKDDLTILDTGTNETVVPGGIENVKALATDDRRSAFWLIDKDGQLVRYSLDGAEQQRIDLRVDAEPATDPAEGLPWQFDDVLRELLRLVAGLIFGNHDFDSTNHVQLVVDKTDGSVWAGAGRTLRRYLADGTLHVEVHPPYDIGAIAFDWRTRNVLIGADHRIQGFAADGALTRDESLAQTVRALAFDDREGWLWAGLVNKDVVGRDREGNIVASFRAQQLDHLAAGNDSTLWITKTKTVYHYSANGQLLDTFDLPNAGPAVNATAFEPNHGALWLGREKEVQRLDADGAVTTVLPGMKNQEALAANGDITPPQFSSLEPANDALVGARPEFRLQVSDAGLGVDPAATELLIAGEPVVLLCGWESDAAGENGATLTCTPMADITDFHPVIELRVADFAGNLSATITINLRLDTDGDGVEDALDTYPQDPSRHQLAPVEGLDVTLENETAQLSWQPHADPDNTTGYLVFRTPAGESERVLLVEEPVIATTYSDENIDNGSGYVYEIIAVDARGNESEAGEGVEFFAAWNDSTVAGFTAARELAAGRLNWEESAEQRYRVYRAEGAESEDFTVGQEIDAGVTTWLDESTLWHTPYRYRIATLRDFTNVFTNEALIIEGTLSPVVDLAPLPPLEIALNDGAPAPDGMREILLIQSPVAISGTYTEARGPVTVAASNGSATVTGNFTDGGFRLLLPANAGETWTITVSEQLIVNRGAQTVVRFIADTTPPVITLDTLAAETEEEFLLITGTVTEDLTGLDVLVARSDRYTGQDFGLMLGEGDRFSGEVPLENGANLITVRAVDGVGNAAETSHTARRKPSLKPDIEISVPHDGYITQQSAINVSGRVYTGLAANQVRIVLGGEVLFPSSGPDGADGYPFTFENIQLRDGYNLISVNAETPAGSDTASVVVTYQSEPPPETEPEPPQLELSTGNLDIVTNGDSFYLGGSVTGEGDLTVTVNGEVVDLIDGNFEYLADLAECIDGGATYTIIVTDSTGSSTTETITVNCDRDAPVLALSSPSALAAPSVTTLPGNPVRFAGTVSDSHLSGLTVNGTPVSLAPAAQAGQYAFDTEVLLPQNIASPLRLEAWDSAGNNTVRDFVLRVTSNVGVEIVAPLENAEYLAFESTVPVPVTARIANFDPARHQVQVRGGEGIAVALAMSANTANGIVSLPSTPERQTINVQVADSEGTVIASRRVNINVTDAANIPLEVARIEPENNANGVAPIDPVAIYFNKPVDPEKLVITVKETVHGMDYDLANQKAKGFGEIPEPQLAEVHRDMQPVEGGLAYFEGDRLVSFHARERFHYGADIFVDATYDGEDIGRFTFKTQPLPTILAGKVVDGSGNPVPDVTVSLVEHDLEAITNHQGNYAFGAGSQLKTALPGGRKTVVVNQSLARGMGSAYQRASIQQNQLNDLPLVRLPLLDQAIPFARIRSGQEVASLDRGNLKLNLSNARLGFPDERNDGAVHVQFTELPEILYPMTEGATPQWVYAVQPAGIRVDGAIDVEFAAPALYGSYDYLPENGLLVVIIALDGQSGTVIPAGVGVVDDRKIRTVGPDISFNRLDVIGYAIVPEEKQAVLKKYRNGEIPSLAQLTQMLGE